MSYGEAVLERGAGRRYRWKGRPGLSHKPIKNIACLSDSMSHKAPAERGGFASSALSCKVRRRDNYKGCNFSRACFSSCKASFSCHPLVPPSPLLSGENRNTEVMLKPRVEGGGGKGVQHSHCSSLPCSGPWWSFGLCRCLGAIVGCPVPVLGVPLTAAGCRSASRANCKGGLGVKGGCRQRVLCGRARAEARGTAGW